MKPIVSFDQDSMLLYIKIGGISGVHEFATRPIGELGEWLTEVIYQSANAGYENCRSHGRDWLGLE